MLRALVILIGTGGLFIAGYAQSSSTPRARYTVSNGRCGPTYMLVDTTASFDNPQTTAEILEVIHILRSAPPQADVQCHDFNDAWAPHVYADRNVKIASLLIKLKRYDEAREELWSLYLRDGVLYRGRKLYYEMGKDKAISLLMSRELWSVRDMKGRLKDPRYEYVEQIKMTYERRKRVASSR